VAIFCQTKRIFAGRSSATVKKMREVWAFLDLTVFDPNSCQQFTQQEKTKTKQNSIANGCSKRKILLQNIGSFRSIEPSQPQRLNQ
jgi:hypothetical protein